MPILMVARAIPMVGGMPGIRTDGAHDQPHAMLLASKHMLDLGADFGSPGVGLGGPLGK